MTPRNPPPPVSSDSESDQESDSERDASAVVLPVEAVAVAPAPAPSRRSSLFGKRHAAKNRAGYPTETRYIPPPPPEMFPSYPRETRVSNIGGGQEQQARAASLNRSGRLALGLALSSLPSSASSASAPAPPAPAAPSPAPIVVPAAKTQASRLEDPFDSLFGVMGTDRRGAGGGLFSDDGLFGQIDRMLANMMGEGLFGDAGRMGGATGAGGESFAAGSMYGVCGKKERERIDRGVLPFFFVFARGVWRFY